MNSQAILVIRNDDLTAFNDIISGVTEQKHYRELIGCDKYVLLTELALKKRIEMIRLVLKKEVEIDYVNTGDLKESYSNVASALNEHLENDFIRYRFVYESMAAKNILLEEAANVRNLADNPLFYFYDAIIKKQITLLKILFTGENPNIFTFRFYFEQPCTSDGKTLLDYALETESMEMIKLVWKKVKIAKCIELGETPLHYFVRMNNEKSVDEFAWVGWYEGMIGVDIDDIDAIRFLDSKTALHLAVESGNEDLVRTLLIYGASLNLRTKNNETPLHLAIQKGHVGIVERLLSQDALESEDENSDTPADYAIWARISKHDNADVIANLINEFVFWEEYKKHYDNSKTFQKTTLPKKANIGDILAHAVQADNRTRQVCYDLGWVDEDGVLDPYRQGQFSYADRQHAGFWQAHRLDRENAFFTTSNLPDDATIEEILYHAKNNLGSRSYSVCKQLKWIDKNGNLMDDAPRIQYQTESECVDAFLNLYNRKLQRQWIKKSELPENPDFDDIIAHAQKNRGRSLEVCMILGWLDEDAEVIVKNIPDQVQSTSQIFNI